MTILKINKKTFRQFLKFGTIGGIGFIFDYILVHVGILLLGMQPIWAGLFSFPFVATFTWAGNRFFTFRDVQHQSLSKQLMKFIMVCAVGLTFNRGTYSVVVSYVPQSYSHPFGLPLLDVPAIGLIAGTAAGMFFNFFASKRLVFR